MENPGPIRNPGAFVKYSGVEFDQAEDFYFRVVYQKWEKRKNSLQMKDWSFCLSG